MLRQSQSQKQVQKLIPQIIQKQNLLAIPTIALEQMVRQELELNPFLEENIDELEAQDEILEEDEIPEIDGDEIIQEIKKEDEEFDTDDYVNSDYEGYKASPDGEQDVNYDNMWSYKATMQDNLISQLHLCDLSEKEKFIGEEIIWSLDDEGYFRDEPEEIATDLNKQKEDTILSEENFTAEDVLGVLKIIQTFEPTGIASQNLQECMVSQLKALKIEQSIKKLAINIIENNFDEFRLKNYEKLLKEYNISIDVLNNIFDIISRLNPKPGYLIDDSNSYYIYPDVMITKNGDEYKVELNDRSIPSLRLNDMYSHIMHSLDRDSKDFIKNNIERAKWFLESLRSRKETLLKVVYAILARQKEFFDNQGKNLKPMLEKEIAEDISMDISTISRTVRGKYVQTDFGIFELKYFFSYHMKNDDGEDVSTKEIKNIITGLISEETPSKPYTDDELVKELEIKGFKIARRTIAKYREALKIPVARLRRKI